MVAAPQRKPGRGAEACAGQMTAPGHRRPSPQVFEAPSWKSCRHAPAGTGGDAGLSTRGNAPASPFTFSSPPSICFASRHLRSSTIQKSHRAKHIASEEIIPTRLSGYVNCGNKYHIATII